MNVRQEDAQDIREVLGLGEAPRRRFLRAAALTVLILALIGAEVWYIAGREGNTIRYRTAAPSPLRCKRRCCSPSPKT